MVTVPRLSAIILPNDFPLAHRVEGTSSYLMVCRVRNDSSPEYLEVIWWVELSVVLPLCSVFFYNLHHCMAWGLVEDTSSVSLTHNSNVIDIAFVILLQNQWSICGLMLLVRGTSFLHVASIISLLTIAIWCCYIPLLLIPFSSNVYYVCDYLFSAMIL